MKKYLFLLLSAGALGMSSSTLSSCGSKAKMTERQRTELEDIFQMLKRDIPEADVTMDQNRVKVVLPEALLFDVNSSVIHNSYKPTLAKLALALNKYQKTSVLITGYTDISGSKEVNDELSWRRAESAKQVLVNNNVRFKRIYTWGFGSKNPIATNATAEGRMQNRRVEFVILYDYQGGTKTK